MTSGDLGRWWLVLAFNMLSACGHGGESTTSSSTPGGNLPPVQTNATPAAATGSVYGKIVDADSGNHIAGATVKLGPAGEVTGTTTDLGTYAVTGVSGHSRLEVSAPGYITWAQEIGVGRSTLAHNVALLKRANTQAVPPGGGTVTAGAASLVFPAGAYATTTAVSATLVPHGKTYALPARQVVKNEQGLFQLDSALVVSAPTEPNQPVTVKLPAPAGNAVIVQVADDGTSAQLPPTIDNGIATVTVTHFSMLEVWLGIDPATSNDACFVWVVTSVIGEVDATRPDGSSFTVVAGDAVAASQQVTHTSDAYASVSLESAFGRVDVSTFKQGVMAVLDKPSTAQLDKQSQCGLTVLMKHGKARVTDFLADVTGWNATEGKIATFWEGLKNPFSTTPSETVYSVEADECAGDTTKEIVDVEVTSGSVDIGEVAQPVHVANGQDLEACIDCDSSASWDTAKATCPACTPDFLQGVDSAVGPCNQNSDCCSGFCNSEKYCGCVPDSNHVSLTFCNQDSDCCNGPCNFSPSGCSGAAPLSGGCCGG